MSRLKDMEILYKYALTYIPLGSASIVRPSPETRVKMRAKAESHLKAKYPPGRYTDPVKCNEILQYFFSFYQNQLDEVIPRIATSRWVGEILYQYEGSGTVAQKFKRGELTEEDHQRWLEIGPTFRQSLDLICEKLAAIGEIDNIQGQWQTQIPDFENVLLCAEKCVEYANMSNYTFMVVPHATSITIHPAGENPYFEHIIDESVHRTITDYLQQNNKEVTLRNDYLEQAFDPFDHQYHALILNPVFLNVFGISYKQFQDVVTAAPASFGAITSYKNVPICLKDQLMEGVAEDTGIPKHKVSAVTEMLILDRAVPRAVWNSRQDNRINKRPLLEFNSKGRTVLMWSTKKVEDFLSLLDSDITFNKPPSSWAHESLTSAVTEISNAAGKWFERSVISNLEQLDFYGSSIGNKTFEKFNEVVFDCGQIDFLGYHPATKCLVVLEFKMFETGFDARGVRQVKSSFLDGKDAYTKIFSKKLRWVNNNLAFVKTYLSNTYNMTLTEDTMEVKAAFITYYPSLMNLFFTDPPCISLVQFVDDFKSRGQWPY